MLYLAHRLFSDEIAKDFAKRLMLSNEWVDGRASAKDSQVKRNLQLNLGETHKEFSQEVITIIENDEVINNFAFSSKIFNILFTRTGEGMFYGPHIDSPCCSTGRRDLSFTIFLNQTKDYQGGELILYIPPEKKQIKMNPGEMIIYPTKYLHEVKEVTNGERMVCVGWIESEIAKDDERESLGLIKKGLSEIIQKHGHSSSTQNIDLSFNNLYRSFSR